MTHRSSWLTHPADAYRAWQNDDATGADKRPFSERSVIQHIAMFDRFLRHLIAKDVDLATFSAAHLESFFADVDNRCAPGTTTRLRYVKLIDRLCRHLVEIGLRQVNPAADFARAQVWPEDEPEPLFLNAEADARLQAYVQPQATDEVRDMRNRAIVGLLIGTGVTSIEIRSAKHRHLIVEGPRPEMIVPKRGPRDERRIPLPSFALVPASRYCEALASSAQPDGLLFPVVKMGKTMSDMMLIKIVKAALQAIDFRAPDMSPRVLRNTYARRLLLEGRSNDEVSQLLGLSSQRTVVRLRATL
jgi:site-specific recombinase XerD